MQPASRQQYRPLAMPYKLHPAPFKKKKFQKEFQKDFQKSFPQGHQESVLPAAGLCSGRSCQL